VQRRPVGGVVLWLLAAGLTAWEWWAPLRGVVSFALQAAFTLLLAPWAFQLFRREDSELPAHPVAGIAAPPERRSILPRLILCSLMVSVVAAKWLVLTKASGTAVEFRGSSQSYTLAQLLVFGSGLLARGRLFARFVALVVDHPARLMALSFSTTGIIGAFLLSLPISIERVHSVSLVDNLFMAFSAVCVTGLSVNNVAETYTLFGQAILCLLIQIGGLGIMVLSAAIAVLAGRRMRVKSSAVLAEMVDVRSLAELRRTVVMILVYTLVIEACGASLLYLEFKAHPDIERRYGHDLAGAGDIRWAAVFHAVSAFCNAGFSNLTAGVVPFVGHPVFVCIISLLVVLGGIGFPVLDELLRSLFRRLLLKRTTILSLNTRVALRMTAILLVGMTLVYFIFEWHHSMKSLGVLERFAASIFQSISARSAGFNIIDIGAMGPAVLVITCFAMFVGASPGGTGGGIKTTTLAVLLAGVRSELTGRPPRLLNRFIPEGVIRRAISVAFLGVTIILFAFIILLLLEPHPPLALVFEVVSAFSTTGLSTGITPKLSVPGKLIVLLLMFIGRIGPLTLALALARSATRRNLALPEERVMIG
jgi:trk system potassium uptake protein